MKRLLCLFGIHVLPQITADHIGLGRATLCRRCGWPFWVLAEPTRVIETPQGPAIQGKYYWRAASRRHVRYMRKWFPELLIIERVKA